MFQFLLQNLSQKASPSEPGSLSLIFSQKLHLSFSKQIYFYQIYMHLYHKSLWFKIQDLSEKTNPSEPCSSSLYLFRDYAFEVFLLKQILSFLNLTEILTFDQVYTFSKYFILCHPIQPDCQLRQNDICGFKFVR